MVIEGILALEHDPSCMEHRHTPAGEEVLMDPAKAGLVVLDGKGETVALATILTMVKKLDQN